MKNKNKYIILITIFLTVVSLFSKGQILKPELIIDTIFCNKYVINIYKNQEIGILNFQCLNAINFEKHLKSCIKFKIYNSRNSFIENLKRKNELTLLNISKIYSSDSLELMYYFDIVKITYPLFLKSGLEIFLNEEFEAKINYQKENDIWKLNKIDLPSNVISPTINELIDSIKNNK